LNAGIRYDYNTKSGGEWVPQGGVSVQASPTTIIKAIVSKGFRNPTIRELYMFGTKNDSLKSEKMVNYELSVGQSFFDRKLNFELNGFYIDGKNQIQSLPNDKYRNSGEFKNAGIELAGNYRVNHYLNLNLNYSYLHLKVPVLAAPKHNLMAAGRYARAGWTAYTSLQYIGDLYTIIPTATIPETLENYLMWDLTVGYQFNKYLEGFVKGENLLNQTYEINYGYPMPGATVMAGVSIKI
jgi:iron complex outermembrane receptor protein